jgi:ribonuclease HII
VVPTQDEELTLNLAGFVYIAGVDEVGRGPIAGPVVAGAVILPSLSNIEVQDIFLIRDSKTLSKKQLPQADQLVRKHASCIGIGEVSNVEIDAIGIAPAVRKAMHLALDQLSIPPDHILSDAFPIDWRHKPCKPIIKGDALCTVISAASIVAKVYRDRVMDLFNEEYPGYGFDTHKGYASSKHLDAIDKKGATPIHRLSFSPFKPRLF